MGSPYEQIDNIFTKRGEYEKYIKRQTAKYRRRKVKQFLNHYDESKPEPNDKQYAGWTE